MVVRGDVGVISEVETQVRDSVKDLVKILVRVWVGALRQAQV